MAACHPDRKHFAKQQCRQCYRHTYRQTHLAQHRAYAKAYKRRHPAKVKSAAQKLHYRATYGLTVEQIEELRETQGGRCAICAQELIKPQVDHCHATGKVRGLLCGNCNRGLGIFGDSAKLLRDAASYLEGP